MLRRTVTLLALFALLALGPRDATAQRNSTGDAGSIYSRFGIGQLESFASSQSEALGGGGAALWTYNYPTFDNPASLSRQVVVRAVGGFRMQRLTIEDAAGSSSTINSGSLGAVQFGLPILQDRFGLGFSFTPYSRVNYQVQTRGELITDPLQQDTTAYRISYEGAGGLQELSAGAGYRVTDALSLGLSADMIFGIIEDGRRTIFESSAFTETNLTTSTQTRGLTATGGALYTLSNVFREQDDLNVGLSIRLPTKLDADRSRTLGESLDRDTLAADLSGDIDLPWSLRSGLSYRTDNRWTATVNARYEPWSQFDSDFGFPGFDPDGASQMNDRLRLSGGLEVVPAGDDQLAPYVQRVAYRLGGYYDQAYVAPSDDLSLRTIAVTGGLGLPTAFPGTHLDINFQVGTRGSAEDDFVRDLFVGFSATLNMGERWFRKRKLR